MNKNFLLHISPHINNNLYQDLSTINSIGYRILKKYNKIELDEFFKNELDYRENINKYSLKYLLKNQKDNFRPDVNHIADKIFNDRNLLKVITHHYRFSPKLSEFTLNDVYKNQGIKVFLKRIIKKFDNYIAESEYLDSRYIHTQMKVFKMNDDSVINLISFSAMFGSIIAK